MQPQSSYRSDGTTYLVIDVNDDRLLDVADFMLAFTGPGAPPGFAKGDFTANTFTAIVGTSGPDVLVGTAGNDRIHGAPGADDIDALAGDDTVFAGDGDDSVRGDDGHDVLDGGAGNDTLDGGDGNDQLNAGADSADAMNWLQGGSCPC